MDNTIILYLIKTSISIALFYGAYALCLRKDTFLRLRRVYFLFAIAFSLIFPAFNIEIPIVEDAPLQIPTYWLSEFYATNQEVQNTQEYTAINIQEIVFIAICIISFICIVRFFIQLLSIIKLRRRSESEKFQKYRIVKMQAAQLSPFSFFNWIFINSENNDTHQLKEIIAHEQVHVRQYHSVDNLLSELLCAFFWWNPFAWLIKKEIKINLEYLADQGVLDLGYDTKKYQYILLQVSNKNTGIQLINNFNVSQLKKRIIMMNRKKSSLLISAKYLLIVPLAASLLLGNAVQASPDLLKSATSEFIQDGKDVDASYAIPISFSLNDSQISTMNSPNNTSIVEISHGTKDETTVLQDGKNTNKKKAAITVQQMPTYPGGQTEMQRYIKENLKYPKSAIDKNIQGRVTVRFIVKEDGTTDDITVIRGIGPECDAEVVRLISNMPKWIPGKEKGKNVPVYFTLPIQYKLPKKKDINQTPTK